MNSFPPVYVLRHGETEWNLTGRLQGRFDSALTPEGIVQSRMQRDILRRHELAGFAAISSPQGRALETARIALEGVIDPIATDPALSEIGLGDWAGEDRAALIARTGACDGFALYELAPGGEGFAALRSRCERFLRGLEGPSVLITHGITSRMIRLILTGRPTAELRRIDGGQGVVFRVAGGRQERLTIGG
ncbi:histidine phosphatase family protein [Marimonas sp. MJW-29]|uniref:Histidine phosphatase family protein n=1 Tax=Sulfitobacter sediminis TaxID=3234186 RepID=A0ABV3RKM1_9RHOB